MNDFYPPGLLSALNINPEDLRRQQQQAGLLNAGLQMLASSGYSPVRRSLGEIVGQAGIAGIQGMQQTGESAIERALQGVKVQSLQQQMEDASGARARKQSIQSALALPTPKEQIQALQRLGAYDEIAGLGKATQEIRKAGLLRPEGVEIENPFLPYTQAQSPQVRQLAQTYLQGFSSGRIDEDTADKRISDLAKMEESYASRIASREQASATREAASMERETKRLEGTEGQKLAAGFASRMESANSIIDSLENKNVGLPTAFTDVAGGVPFVGGYLQQKAMTPEQQKYKQAADNWIRANLRKESGASIPLEEMALEYQTYFPVPGNDPATIAQKAEARKITTEAMITNAGPVYRPTKKSVRPENIQNQQDLQSAAMAELERRRKGGK